MSSVHAQGSEELEDSASQRLYLAVILNQVALPSVHEVVRSRNATYMTYEALRVLGVRAPSTSAEAGRVRLEALPDTIVEYDKGRQELRLTVPPALIDGMPLRLTAGILKDADVDLTQRVEGVLLNYDLFAQSSANTAAASAYLEGRILSATPGILTQTLVARWSQTPTGQPTDLIRLDTTWKRDDPGELSTFTVGDTITGSLSWTRPMRIAGIQIGRDLGLRPYRPKTPLLTFDGEAALPSMVELFINGVRQMGHAVRPGQFHIDAMPSITGAGSAQIVLTDLNGRVQRTNWDFYAAPNLLQEGLWDGSLEIGYPRHGYGLQSANYASRAVALATGRYGLNHAFTLEGHAEITDGVRTVGAGALYRLPRSLGLMSGALAHSTSGRLSGVQHALSYQLIGARASLTGTWLHRSRNYRDVATAFDGPPSRALASVSLGVATPLGRLGLGWVRHTPAEGNDHSLFSIGLTRELPWNSLLHVSWIGGQVDSTRTRKLTLTWSIPLERGSLSTAFNHDSRGSLRAVEVTRDPPQNEGLGYRLQATLDRGGVGAQGQLTYSSRRAQWIAGLDHTDRAGAPLLYGGVNGSLWASAGRIHSFQRAGDAFAVVSTSGVSNVPVRLENRVVGLTDETGVLLLPRISPYQRNHVSIDTLHLPVDYQIDTVRTDAVPERRGGVLVRFGLRRLNPLEVTLVDSNGHPLAVGTPVEITPGSSTVVGHDGYVYIEDATQEEMTLRARDGTGRCSATIALKSEANSIGVGARVVTCRGQP